MFSPVAEAFAVFLRREEEGKDGRAAPLCLNLVQTEVKQGDERD